MKFNKGFTLIELLVVIAIIGILASVILASLNSARSKGNDASIKANLSNARAQAELFYDANGYSYYGSANEQRLCSSAADADGTKGVVDFATAAQKSFAANSGVVPYGANASAATWSRGACHSSTNAWVITIPLNASTSGSPVHWCVDSTGFAGQVTTVVGADVFSCS